MGLLIKNIHVLGDDKAVRRDIYIDSENGCIAGVDRMPEGFAADEVIDGSHKVLMPGMVNAHTHAYMSVFRNYAHEQKKAVFIVTHESDAMKYSDRIFRMDGGQLTDAADTKDAAPA